jgi:copper(I)-binding protein
MSIYLALDHGYVTRRRSGGPVVAHLTIRNTTESPERLIEVYSPDYDEVRLRCTTLGMDECGRSRLSSRNLAFVVVPPNGEVILGSRECYVVASWPRRSLRAEDHVRLALRFASETTLIARLPVLRTRDQASEQLMEPGPDTERWDRRQPRR